MNKLVTAAQMRKCDKEAEHAQQISELVLIERAAGALAGVFFDVRKSKTDSVAVLCGGGSNGADGAACALLLNSRGVPCDVFYVYDRLSESGAHFRDKLHTANIATYENPDRFDFTSYGTIIDALFGTGLTRVLEGRYADAVAAVNGSGAFVLSADMPSGLCADTPFPESAPIVQADVTVTFAAYKAAQLFWGTDACGTLILKDVDIPVPCGTEVWDSAACLVPYFPKRKKISHKGSYGKLCLFAGSMPYFGAAQIGRAHV